MKKQVTILITLISAVVFGTISCQPSSSEKLQDAQVEAAEADQVLSNAKEEYLTDMETFKEETGVKISENKQRIEELKASIANLENEAKAQYDQDINDLELKNVEMRGRLEEYEMEGKDQWNDFKEQLSLDMDEMESALQDLTLDDK